MEAVFNSFKIENIHYSVYKKMKGEKGKHTVYFAHTIIVIFPLTCFHCVLLVVDTTK